jgi:metal-responsive CopG/Arc/MetJ family transcriptional regulator
VKNTNININRNTIVISASIPPQLAKKIDSERGKINRSLFLRDIIEKGLAEGAATQTK